MRPTLTAVICLILSAPASANSCRQLQSAARTLKLDFPPSTPNIKNCSDIGDEASNYVLASDPASPMELHVVSVHEGSFPADLTRAGSESPDKAVRVIVYKTGMPAVLFLNSHKGVLWDLTVNQNAQLERVVVQGRGPQKVQGVPDGIPVIYRKPEDACARAHGWEKKFNRRGADFKTLITGIRCATGLRETSFQACASGALFEVPHYRLDAKPKAIKDPAPACPLQNYAPDKALAVYAPPSAPAPPPMVRGLRVSAKRPRVGMSMIPTAGTRTTEFPKRNDLPAPKSPPARSKIPVRALAILLEGNTSLATHDAVPDLIIALEKGDERLRARAADALGNMGQNASLAVDALKSGLKKDKNMRVRSNCALALGKIGPKARSAIRLLRKAAKNDHADLRLSAQTALENLTREED